MGLVTISWHDWFLGLFMQNAALRPLDLWTVAPLKEYYWS